MPRKLRRNKLRRNPTAAHLEPSLIENVTSVAGNLMVNQALAGASLEERVIVSTFIPMLLKVIRTAPKKDTTVVVDEILTKKDDSDRA